MPNVMGVLRQEIRRLARKESKEAVRDLKRQVTAMRRRLAATKKRISDVERAARAAVSARGASAARMAKVEDGGAQIRFSPKWVSRHRSKLKMSRRVYAKLVGVSPQTILLWESGKARPRRSALASWRSIRGKGIRELKASLGGDVGGRRGRKPGAAAAGGRKRKGRGRRAAAGRKVSARRAGAKKGRKAGMKRGGRRRTAARRATASARRGAGRSSAASRRRGAGASPRRGRIARAARRAGPKKK